MTDQEPPRRTTIGADVSDSGTPGPLNRREAIKGVVASGLALPVFAGSVANAASQAVPASPESRRLPRHMTPATDAAITRGLDWLASRQKRDGGFGESRTYARNVGVCALCGLAFLPQGMEGPYRNAIDGCTGYLLGRAQANGFIVEEHVVTHAPMYGHGFATTYLSQVYGMDLRPELRSILKKAVSLIVSLQDDNGAWRYTPFPEDADVSITTCQMMALASARQAGLAVPPDAMAKSVGFLLSCQNADGGFKYRLIDPPESLFPRSAAAVVALHAAGLHHEPPTTRGRSYLAVPRSPVSSDAPAPHNAEYYYYGRYYGTHAAWQAGGDAWETWYPIVREDLLARQSSDGHWHDPNIGDEYATAMALLTLQFPFDTLPLYLL